MPDITIRPARLEDAERIASFQEAMALETENKTLDPERALAGVRHGLEDPHKARYFVAEREGEVVAALGLSFEWSDWRDGWYWWIQSVYTVPEARGQGAYRALYEEVHAQAEAREDVLGIRLYVEVHNQRARAVYERLGMLEAPYRQYQVSFSAP